MRWQWHQFFSAVASCFSWGGKGGGGHLSILDVEPPCLPQWIQLILTGHLVQTTPHWVSPRSPAGVTCTFPWEKSANLTFRCCRRVAGENFTPGQRMKVFVQESHICVRWGGGETHCAFPSPGVQFAVRVSRSFVTQIPEVDFPVHQSEHIN